MCPYRYRMNTNVLMTTSISTELAEGFTPCFKEVLVKRLRREMPGEDALQKAAVLFSALGDPARLKIFWAMRKGQELCVCDVSHVLGTTVSTASHHLRKLRDLQLLRKRNDGKMIYYSLNSELAGSLVEDVLRLSRGKHG